MSSLEASTFLGGTGGVVSEGRAIAYDPANSVYVTGVGEPDVTFGAFDETSNGVDDSFVSRLANDLSGLTASTLIGGTSFDASNAIAVDSSGDIFLAGETLSTDYPTSFDAYDTQIDGQDGIISRLTNALGDPNPNSPPVAVGDSGVTFETNSVIIDLLANDSDLEDTPTVSVVNRLLFRRFHISTGPMELVGFHSHYFCVSTLIHFLSRKTKSLVEVYTVFLLGGFP